MYNLLVIRYILILTRQCEENLKKNKFIPTVLAFNKSKWYNKFTIIPMGIVGDTHEDFYKRQIWIEGNG